jgi:hypothetical protein
MLKQLLTLLNQITTSIRPNSVIKTTLIPSLEKQKTRDSLQSRCFFAKTIAATLTMPMTMQNVHNKNDRTSLQIIAIFIQLTCIQSVYANVFDWFYCGKRLEINKWNRLLNLFWNCFG